MGTVYLRQTLPANPSLDTNACAAQALRQRPVEAVARAACQTFLGQDAITIELDDGSGRRWCEGLASLRREYESRCADLDRQRGGHAWLWNLEYEMGLRAVETLAASLCHLFGVHADDFARRALAMECVAALTHNGLIRHDEGSLLAQARGTDGATPPHVRHRKLTLTRAGQGRLLLHKETHWDGAALPAPAEGTRGGPASPPAGSDSAIRVSTFDARFDVAVLRPGRWRAGVGGDGPARRARLRCKIDPVQLQCEQGDGAMEAALHWQRRLALAIRAVRQLFRRLIGDDMALRYEVRLLVHRRGVLPPSAVRVGEDWHTRQSTQPLCQGVRHGYDEMRLINEGLRLRQYQREAVHREAVPKTDDSLRLY